jgi:hypothetical protein
MRRSVLLAVVVVAALASVAYAPASAQPTAQPTCAIPAGFLRFLGGGEGDPNDLTPVAAFPLPETLLGFFAGAEGDPYNVPVASYGCFAAPGSPAAMPSASSAP